MGSSIPIVATNKGNLSFDGYDANSKIGFIYLSKDDIDSSTNVKEFKDFAKSYTYYDVFSSVLSGNIKNNQKENKVWVFYNFRSIDKASAKKNLREQVQYFLNLLKA